MEQLKKHKKFSELDDAEMQLLYSYLFELDIGSPSMYSQLYYLEYVFGLQTGELFRLYDQLMAAVSPIKGYFSNSKEFDGGLKF